KIEIVGFKVDPNIKAEPIGNRSNRGNSSNQNRTAKPKETTSNSKRSFGKKRVEENSSSNAKPRGFASKNRRTNSGFKNN
ncbi:MAG: hypothetical protein IE890_06055, partial [Arcobacter sp.]|nr:hypothetical protein [Arcobacter sp.]